MNKAKKIVSILTLIIGLLVIVMGVKVMNTSVSDSLGGSYTDFEVGEFDVWGASFGADFYTYMYDASDMIVEELNAINNGLEIVVDGQNSLRSAMGSVMRATNGVNETVSKTGGAVVIAIGAAIFAQGLPVAVEAFSVPAKKEQENQEQQEELPAAEM